MNKLFEVTDRLLSLLPFNGDKTVIAMGLKLSLPLAVAQFPVILVAVPFIDATLDFLIATGLAHKLVKAKLPEEKKSE